MNDERETDGHAAELESLRAELREARINEKVFRYRCSDCGGEISTCSGFDAACPHCMDKMRHQLKASRAERDVAASEAAELRQRLQAAHGALYSLRHPEDVNKPLGEWRWHPGGLRELSQHYELADLLNKTRPDKVSGVAVLVELREARERVAYLEAYVEANFLGKPRKVRPEEARAYPEDDPRVKSDSDIMDGTFLGRIGDVDIYECTRRGEPGVYCVHSGGTDAMSVRELFDPEHPMVVDSDVGIPMVDPEGPVAWEDVRQLLTLSRRGGRRP